MQADEILGEYTELGFSLKRVSQSEVSLMLKGTTIGKPLDMRFPEVIRAACKQYVQSALEAEVATWTR